MWDVTYYRKKISVSPRFLLTHPVWDVTLSYKLLTLTDSISTHTSRVGCDYNLISVKIIMEGFLLTHPVWDVTL